jgi:hypothetical protein
MHDMFFVKTQPGLNTNGSRMYPIFVANILFEFMRLIMKHPICLLAAFFLFTFCPLQAQQGFENVFSNLAGDELIDSLASHYRPNTVLSYADARDTLYAKILAIDDDSIRCIYSGHTLYLAHNQDPTQYIYLNGSSNGINTEHAYPQAKGALDGNAKSDMHHLYPARIPVNEARGDKPFLDIADNQVDKWFVNNTVLTTIPTSNIDAYSESRATAFEPREKVKGDLARSIFYFYTMYRGQANAADPNYFEIQRLTLCKWNEQDPADSAELKKTWRIAAYQEGKPNPFVLDCTVAARSWCPEVAPACATAVHEAFDRKPLQMQLSPNPANSPMLNCQLYLPFSGNLQCRLVNMLGQDMKSIILENVPTGPYQINLDLSGLAPAGSLQGYWMVTLQGTQQQLKEAQSFMIVR